MNMIACVIREPGDPSVLELREVPIPSVPPGHVRVRVHATAVNRADLLQRRGLYPAPKGDPADIPGLEYAGVVEALGDNVFERAVGDRVYGLVGGGAYAQYVVVPEASAAVLPEGLGFADAAALPEAAITAYDAMIVRAGLSAGETVLVHAVGSGVGLAALQIARAAGARVIGTARTQDKLDRAHGLGLDIAVLCRDAKFAATVNDATQGRGVSLVLDLVGGPYTAESMLCSASKARIVLVGLLAGAKHEMDLGVLLRKRLTLAGTVLRSRPLSEKLAAAQLLAERISPLVAAGSLRPVVHAVLPLARAAEAHAMCEANETFGKVVLSLD